MDSRRSQSPRSTSRGGLNDSFASSKSVPISTRNATAKNDSDSNFKTNVPSSSSSSSAHKVTDERREMSRSQEELQSSVVTISDLPESDKKKLLRLVQELMNMKQVLSDAAQEKKVLQTRLADAIAKNKQFEESIKSLKEQLAEQSAYSPSSSPSRLQVELSLSRKKNEVYESQITGFKSIIQSLESDVTRFTELITHQQEKMLATQAKSVEEITDKDRLIATLQAEVESLRIARNSASQQLQQSQISQQKEQHRSEEDIVNNQSVEREEIQALREQHSSDLSTIDHLKSQMEAQRLADLKAHSEVVEQLRSQVTELQVALKIQQYNEKKFLALEQKTAKLLVERNRLQEELNKRDHARDLEKNGGSIRGSNLHGRAVTGSRVDVAVGTATDDDPPLQLSHKTASAPIPTVSTSRDFISNSAPLLASVNNSSSSSRGGGGSLHPTPSGPVVAPVSRPVLGRRNSRAVTSSPSERSHQSRVHKTSHQPQQVIKHVVLTPVKEEDEGAALNDSGTDLLLVVPELRTPTRSVDRSVSTLNSAATNGEFQSSASSQNHHRKAVSVPPTLDDYFIASPSVSVSAPVPDQRSSLMLPTRINPWFAQPRRSNVTKPNLAYHPIGRANTRSNARVSGGYRSRGGLHIASSINNIASVASSTRVTQLIGDQRLEGLYEDSLFTLLDELELLSAK